MTTTLSAQDLGAAKLTLLKFNATATAGVCDRLDKYEPESEREKLNYRRFQDSLNLHLTRMGVKTLYAQMEAKSLNLEPTDAIAEWVNYNANGLPNVLIPKTVIKKLIGKGYASDYYLTIQVTAEPRSLVGGFAGGMTPKVACRIKIFDEERKVVAKYDGESVSNTSIRASEFPRPGFDKTSYDHILALVPYLTPLVEAAISNTVNQL